MGADEEGTLARLKAHRSEGARDDRCRSPCPRRRDDALFFSVPGDGVATALMRSDAAARLLAAGVLLLWCSATAAQELVHFPSSEDNGPGRPSTALDGYVFRPAGEGRHPAVVFLHGCGGLFDRMSGFVEPGERDWAAELTRRGYV